MKPKVLFNDLQSRNRENEDYFSNLKVTDRGIYSIDSNLMLMQMMSGSILR